VLELTVHNLLESRERLRASFRRQLAANETAPGSMPGMNSVDDMFLHKVMALVDEFMDDPEFNVASLSQKLAMSQPVLYKKIKAVTNLSVNDFIKSLRLKKAAQLLREKQMNVSEISYAVGYNDRRYFSREFKKHYGKLPSEY